MRVKCYTKTVKDKMFGPYYQKCDFDGTGSSVHIGAEEFHDLKGFLEEEREVVRQMKTFRKQVPEQCFSEDEKESLKECGWNVTGSRLTINRKTFFTIETARKRFSLLDAESKKKIGSPERYLMLLKKSWDLHKKLNALKKPNTFGECFELLLKK